MKLDVYVNGVLTGVLDQVEISKYVFTYHPQAQPAQAISLLMPVRTESWVHRDLHPVFQVSLPEGSLRQILTAKFAKQFPRFGNTELLSVVGSHLVGRIQVTAHGAPLNTDSPHENLKSVLQWSTQEALDHYLGEHACYSGVSGGFPKVLVKSLTMTEVDGKNTLIFDHWIVKADDSDRPFLVLNEYFGLRVAQEMGLPTPTFHLAEDCTRIAIERFDVAVDQASGIQHKGFEDMCSLLALNSSDKFSGSLERVIRVLNEFCCEAAKQDSISRFYAQYSACMAIRNGDAHLKNFGLVYTGLDDAELSPVYDMLTMSAYALRAQHGDALDEPALSFGGVRRWFTPKTQAQFAARCRVSASEQKRVSHTLCKAMEIVAGEIVAKAAEVESFQPTAQRLLELWSHGLKIHGEESSQQIMAMKDSIRARSEGMNQSQDDEDETTPAASAW